MLFRQHCLDFFLCSVVWSLWNNMAWGFSCVMFSLEYNITLHWIFPVQCCLDPFGQHCIGLLLEQYCPNSIKTTLNRIFSWALSGVSRTTLGRVFFICAVLSQEYYLLGQHCTGKTLRSVVFEASDNIA